MEYFNRVLFINLIVIFSIFNISADGENSIKLTIEGTNIGLEREVEDIIIDALHSNGFIASDEVTTALYIFIQDYFNNLKSRDVSHSYKMLTKRYTTSTDIDIYTQWIDSIYNVEMESLIIDSVDINSARAYTILLVENSMREISNIDFYIELKYDISLGWLIDSVSNRN